MIKTREDLINALTGLGLCREMMIASKTKKDRRMFQEKARKIKEDLRRYCERRQGTLFDI